MQNDLKPEEAMALKEVTRIMMAHHFALRVAVASLLRTHPDAEAVLRYFDSIAESLRATLLNSEWSEARIEDFEFHLDALRRDLTHQMSPPPV